MYTTAGDWALRESFPEKDSGVAKELRAHGVVILGKAGLSEWANSFGSQPSGFGNVTGQVLNANDAAQGPSGSSSGSGASAAAALSALTIGTETGGSIISPSTAENVVGLRPTLGLVPGYGIAPIDASRDTAGPIVRTVADAAMTLQSIAEVTGTDPEANEEYEAIMGPEFLKNGDIQPAPFTTLPDYLSALDLNFVNGKRIGYNGTTCTVLPPETSCTPTPTEEATLKAKEVLEAAGAIMVPDASPHDAGGSAATERLRAPRDDRRLLQASRLARAGQEPQARGRSRRDRPPGGPQVRQPDSPLRVRSRRHAGRSQPAGLRQGAAGREEGLPRTDRKDDE